MMNNEQSEVQKAAEDRYPSREYWPNANALREGYIAGHKSRDAEIAAQAIAFAEWIEEKCYYAVPFGWYSRLEYHRGPISSVDLYGLFTDQTKDK